MKKLLLLTGAIIALGGITSCSDDNVASIDPVSTQAEENTPVSFGTYLGNGKSTRTGTTGSMTTENLKKTTGGFGVFAYYTETKLFEEAESSSRMNLNFMNNEKVSWDDTNNKWNCFTTKYWPNPTTTDGETTKPQYVTFLAYAPYVSGPRANTNYGITDIVQNGTEGAYGKNTAQTKYSDVMVKWSKNSTDATGDVDLLWGTAGTNGEPATIADDGWDKTQTLHNYGKSYVNTTDETHFPPNNTAVNANLTKMKTDGKVQFVFKHALGAFGGFPGGSETSAGNGILIDYLNDVNSTNGNSAISGRKTRVFVNWIAVEFMSGDETTNASGEKAYNGIPNEGYFDLVTGQWYYDRKLDNSSGSGANSTNRTKDIYYFSPDGAAPASGDDGYQKYLDTYTTNGIKYRIANKALDTHIYQVAYSSKPNDYDKWIYPSGAWKEGLGYGVTEKSHTIYKNAESPIFLIPGTKVTVKVVVNYDIVKADANLTNYYALAHQEMAKQVDFKNVINMNNMYALYIHLGLTSIKFDATVNYIGTDNDQSTSQSNPAVTTEIEDADISPNEVPSTTEP